MGKDRRFVGLDLGSAFVHLVVVDGEGAVCFSDSAEHSGKIAESVFLLLERAGLDFLHGMYLNLRAVRYFGEEKWADEQVALLEAVRKSVPGARGILHMGAEKFRLLVLDEEGNYRKSFANSGCASGTGSFLDQQARRLGLNGAEELGSRAFAFRGEAPRIATRCAVFAKTDLIHAQQKGYSLDAICAGLCQGVARNILDVVAKEGALPSPLVVSGGVARNSAVVRELRRAGSDVRVFPRPQQAVALGLAYLAAEKMANGQPVSLHTLRKRWKAQSQKKSYYYRPLSEIPYRKESLPFYQSVQIGGVEAELYRPLEAGKRYGVYFGLDIGSTSTKAALMDEREQVLVGLYTRTQGQPIQAVQRLLRAVRKLEQDYGCRFEYLACGTTGSGRRFIQKVLNADLAVDEITAHARAAYQLRPDVDTILEIGGQDSKFTVVRNGRVVFSVMNYVCAAGTGSFLEEQAQRLGVSLVEYSALAEKASAPLTSDRCTVFMERDLNALLNLGYARDELLAAAIHSVRDNYLTKVAQPQKIGSVIVFQGATGRNAALVKAFEQKLGRPVYVSPYCHIAGALGVSLILKERGVRLNPAFRSELDRIQIQMREEVCTLCANHCKISRIQIGGEEIGFGYLCGREDHDRKPATSKDRNSPLAVREKILFGAILPERKRADLAEMAAQTLREVRWKLLEWKELLAEARPESAETRSAREVRIGLPRSLNYWDTLPLWWRFFRKLGFHPVLSVGKKERVVEGKSLAQAEFCGPIAAFHGHVAELLKSCDFVFLPTFFRNGIGSWNKHYCYYSNYAPALVRNNPHWTTDTRFIAPELDLSGEEDEIARAIHRSLPEGLRTRISAVDLERAYVEALEEFQVSRERLRETFLQREKELRNIGVVLLGRPYLALDRAFNLDLPSKLAKWDIPVFYQDMLPLETLRGGAGQVLRRWNHWNYGEWILRAAEYVARHPKLFPIYLTAFKCSPDSFLLPYFREIMDRYDKPYLILQLDEHHSAEGYETRLEAAVESFRNHRPARKKVPKLELRIQSRPEGKTYLLPNYDPLSTELIAASFRRHGLKALPIEETPETVQASVRWNDGQCLPFSALFQGILHTVKTYNLDPSRTAFFINSVCNLSCNLPQYPVLMKMWLEKLGGGFEKMEVLATDTDFKGMPFSLILDLYCAYLLGGYLQKLVCKVRPREQNPGEADAAARRALKRLVQAFETGDSKERAFREVVERFEAIPLRETPEDLPKVAIIGDLYVRDNYIFNQNLIRELENLGAEVITTPYNFIVRLVAEKYFRQLSDEGRYVNLAVDKTLLLALSYFDRKFSQIAFPVLQEPLPEYGEQDVQVLRRYHLSFRHHGETAQNLMKIFHLLRMYPDIRLFVHVNPIFCCPGLVSEALFKRVEEEIGIPIISIVYDGTQGEQNQVLHPYLHFLREELGKKAAWPVEKRIA